jgi:hypothetical protein
MSKTSAFWHSQAEWEKIHKSNAKRCHDCGALIKHPGVSCSTVRSRLQWSAVHQYDRTQPWDWPPLDLYDPNWPQDAELLRNVTHD